MAQATVLIRASVRGARRKGYELRQAGRSIQTTLLDEFAGHLAPGGLRLVRSFAPPRGGGGRRWPSHSTGRLERGLQARVRSYGGRILMEVISTARSDKGYDYLPVTRFGHKVPIIFPVKAKALRIPLADGVIFRGSVRGYRPDHDWVEDAYLAMQHELDAAADRVGRAVDRSLR